MYKIVIASHGEFGNGIKNSLSYFYNDLSNVIVVTLDKNGLIPFQKKLDELFQKLGQQDVLFFSDLLYGTPFNELSKRAILLSSNFDIITGVNMPIMIEAVNYQEQGASLTDVLPKLVTLGKVDLFSQKIKESNINDDDE
ncbi:PTS sugar transporter subunit IIA [Enterococcus sp. AZ103]|uniref:PTS sugar transporter subunit IIA n=1 Tax=Enterococcus sp. AZ103 TaxID=2774628 RepID=UPI003F27C8B2